MTSEPLIELGEDWARPQEPRRKPKDMTRGRRAVVVGLVITSALGLLSQSATPQEPALSFLSIVPRASFLASSEGIQLVGDLLIVQRPGEILAHDLHGTRRWGYRGDAASTPVLVEIPSSGRFVLVRQLLIGSPQDREVDEGGGVRWLPSGVIALDTVTGAELWRVDAALSPIGGLLAGHDSMRRMQVYQGNPPKLVWQTEPMRASGLDSKRNSVWGLGYDGILVEYYLSTGKRRRSQKVRAPPGADAVALWVAGGRVFLAALGTGQELMVLDAQTFEVLPFPSGWMSPGDCGPVICAYEMGGAYRSGVIDADTGEILWTVSEQSLIESGAGLLALAVDGSGPSAPVVGLRDPETGSVLESLSGWYSAGPRWMPPQVLFEPHDDRTRVAVLEAGGLRVIGTVPYRLSYCQHQDAVLVCGLKDGDLGVWRMRP